MNTIISCSPANTESEFFCFLDLLYFSRLVSSLVEENTVAVGDCIQKVIFLKC